MGTTSTQDKTTEELELEYRRLAKKKSPEGHALREAIKASKAGDDPSEVHVTVAADGPVDPAMGILPSLDSFTSTRQKSAVYWMGVIPGNPGRAADPSKGLTAVDPSGHPPMHSIDNIGGRVTFTEWYTPPEGLGQDGGSRRGQYPGSLVSLTETPDSQLREGLRSTLVRWKQRNGRHAHGYVLRIPSVDAIEEMRGRMGLNEKEVARMKIRADQFEILEGDEPVARYVYCVKVDGPEAANGGRWRPSTTLPPSIEDAGGIESP